MLRSPFKVLLPADVEAVLSVISVVTASVPEEPYSSRVPANSVGSLTRISLEAAASLCLVPVADVTLYSP